MKPKKQGFKTPDNYFEEFEDRLFDKMNKSSLPGHHGFKTPKNYFEGLEDSILRRIQEEDKDAGVVPLFGWKTVTYAASIAACAILIFTIFNNTPSSNKLLDKLEFASIEEYFEDSSTEINANDVIALLNNEELAEMTFDSDYFSDENIEEYLLENLDDTTLLIE